VWEETTNRRVYKTCQDRSSGDPEHCAPRVLLALGDLLNQRAIDGAGDTHIALD
jgi:hypothetical protein